MVTDALRIRTEDPLAQTRGVSTPSSDFCFFMHIVHSISDLRAALAPLGAPAFVPTMGNLHDGHIALMRRAVESGGVPVASIFVNRLQFLPTEDFDRYPRTWDADCKRLVDAGCQFLFAPREHDLYPELQRFTVQPDPQLADALEGAFRPGFFTGVCTVVMKLFSAVFAGKAHGTAVFGQKDFQQLMVVRRMVQQFALPIDIVAAPTERAPDGLALSSRNGFLSPAERSKAVQLRWALQALGAATRAAEGALPQKREALESAACAALDAQGWRTDYLAIRRRSDLQLPEPGDDLVVLGAARLGQTRLIDNLEL